jgi:hypothetical protein
MRRHPLTGIAAAAAACVAALLIAPQTRAQSSACDQLKAKLSARIESSIRSFSLEAVTAGTPLPPGAKAIGTCDGGAYKILLLRSGSASSATASSRPVPVASAAPTVSPVVQVQTPEPPSPRASAPASAVFASNFTAAPAATAVAAIPAVAPALVSPARPEETQTDQRPSATRAADVMRPYWHVIAATVVMLFAAMVWVWLLRRRTVDTAGLPRGPKIRMP